MSRTPVGMGQAPVTPYNENAPQEPWPTTAMRFTDACRLKGISISAARKKLAAGTVRAYVRWGSIYVMDPAELTIRLAKGAGTKAAYPWSPKKKGAG